MQQPLLARGRVTLTPQGNLDVNGRLPTDRGYCTRDHHHVRLCRIRDRRSSHALINPERQSEIHARTARLRPSLHYHVRVAD